jgi:deoxycytidylate deaminase
LRRNDAQKSTPILAWKPVVIELPQVLEAPELIFGLVAPIGVDLDLVTEALTDMLGEMHYETVSEPFRLTRLMREVPIPLPLRRAPYVESIKDRINYANRLRQELGDTVLAALAISAIRTYRLEERLRLQAEGLTGTKKETKPSPVEREEEAPLPNRAYIIRQFKRPEEIGLMRRVYGQQFILVSAYTPIRLRRRRIAELERESRGGLISSVDAQNLAHALVAQDLLEDQDRHGQNVRDAFPLGDVFIDATSRATCEDTLRRFVQLLFGSNEITPSRDEYAMYMAKSASLRSSDLSRQVGAAIFRTSGEVTSLGCNEVPKAGGGTYWSDAENDGRDFVQGQDPNDRAKREILVDLLDRLKKAKHLSQELLKLDSTYDVAKLLLNDTGLGSVAESRLMDLIEFGRIVHAEMSALCDAARKGVPIEGATLFCTTFPCHLCTKAIVAAGIRRVVYLEPYPKSHASNLHDDAIDVEEVGQSVKVSFEAFIGVSPYRYRNLFEKGKRKYSGGRAQKWYQGTRRPMIEIYFPSYFKSELLIVGSLQQNLELLDRKAAQSAEPIQMGPELPPAPKEVDPGPAPR